MKIALCQLELGSLSLNESLEQILDARTKAAKLGAQLCIASLNDPVDENCLKPFAAEKLNQSLNKLVKGPKSKFSPGPDLILGIHSEGLKGEANTERVFLLRPDAVQPIEAQDGIFQWQTRTIINLKPWPFTPMRQISEEADMGRLANVRSAYVLALNLLGGYASQIYTGQSFICAPSGEIMGRAAFCAPDLLLLDNTEASCQRCQENMASISPLPENEDEAIGRALILGIRDFVYRNAQGKAILGLSGGMDSALVACLAKEAIGPQNLTALLMPSPYSSEASVNDAEELARNLGIKSVTLPIALLMAAFERILAPAFALFAPWPGDLSAENIQARIRGVLLMAVANRAQALVLNTGNKSEAAMGYCTLYGDTVGALAVIGDLTKTQVYALGRWYNRWQGREIIPENIFRKEPSAELRPNQKDSDSLPPYARLDPVLEKILAPARDYGLSQEIAELCPRISSSAFKRRQAPPTLLVSGRPLI